MCNMVRINSCYHVSLLSLPAASLARDPKVVWRWAIAREEQMSQVINEIDSGDVTGPPIAGMLKLSLQIKFTVFYSSRP